MQDDKLAALLPVVVVGFHQRALYGPQYSKDLLD